jgi:catechol 2,3-dioxygenase-like lactoylglutathione lyase family enzyme
MQATDAAEASFGLSTIGQIALAVSQLDRAVAFYRDALGMRQLFQVPKMSFSI